jgi:membrane protease YdiL (CAAX protease family)
MEETDLDRRPDFKRGPDITDRVGAFFEVMLVVVLGDLLAIPVLLYAFDIPASRVFQDSSVFFSVLTVKATTTLLLIALLLRVRGQTLSDLGYRSRPLKKEAFIGLLYVPLLFGFVAGIGLLFHFFLPDYVTETNPLLEMLQEPKDLVFFILSSLYAGGIQEEVQRAFILKRFESYLGGSVLGLAVWSTLFGLGHSVQGFDNAIKAGVLGLLFGILYLRRRDLSAPIISHAAYDILIVLAVWFFKEWL